MILSIRYSIRIIPDDWNQLSTLLSSTLSTRQLWQDLRKYSTFITNKQTNIAQPRYLSCQSVWDLWHGINLSDSFHCCFLVSAPLVPLFIHQTDRYDNWSIFSAGGNLIISISRREEVEIRHEEFPRSDLLTSPQSLEQSGPPRCRGVVRGGANASSLMP